MRVVIRGNPYTPYGEFTDGDIVTDEQCPGAFLRHLVEDAKCAEWLDYETKVDDEYQVKKKTLSLPSSGQGRASQKKTRDSRKKKQRS